MVGVVTLLICWIGCLLACGRSGDFVDFLDRGSVVIGLVLVDRLLLVLLVLLFFTFYFFDISLKSGPGCVVLFVLRSQTFMEPIKQYSTNFMSDSNIILQLNEELSHHS